MIVCPPPSRPITADRLAWYLRRKEMERSGERHGVLRREANCIALYHVLENIAGAIVRSLGLYSWGRAKAVEVVMGRLPVVLPRLPAAFDGYRILHLSDLHLNATDGLTEAIALAVAGTEVDLCIITGDYFDSACPGGDAMLSDRLGTVLSAFRARDGIISVLGNHDRADMVPLLEAMGIHVLVNEAVDISRGEANVRLVGCDDGTFFYTEAAERALLTLAGPGFNVALVHSPELACVAAKGNYDLYACGHTHGGQICLPGGWPILTGLQRHRRLAKGMWRQGRMVGFTSPGAGVSGLPIRLFAPAEVTILDLRVG